MWNYNYGVSAAQIGAQEGLGIIHRRFNFNRPFVAALALGNVSVAVVEIYVDKCQCGPCRRAEGVALHLKAAMRSLSPAMQGRMHCPPMQRFGCWTEVG